jgi:hemoglobin-like flavoprotein
MTNPIQHSFELAAERCEDLTPLVYARLFREHPEAEPMFRSQGSDLAKGSMLALTIDAIMDFAGDRTGHFRLIECEVSSHDAYGTPRELFVSFFGVIAETLREILAADWSPEWTRRGGGCWRRSMAWSRRAKYHTSRKLRRHPEIPVQKAINRTAGLPEAVERR